MTNIWYRSTLFKKVCLSQYLGLFWYVQRTEFHVLEFWAYSVFNIRPFAKFPYDAQHMKKALTQFTDNIGPDQHAHPCSLFWVFSIHRHILQYPLILYADNEGPD